MKERRLIIKIFVIVIMLILNMYRLLNDYTIYADSEIVNSDTEIKKMRLNEDFWKSENLAIGVFFSNKIEQNENGDINKTVDSNLGLYVTNDGKNFTYIGETGIIGRDPNMMYKDGVFYMATTKGGSTSGNVAFNVFKSTDLVNWTDDTEYSYAYRYEPSSIQNNKWRLTSTTWSPKWFQDENKTYILVSTARFTEDGGIIYYLKGEENILKDNGLDTTSQEYLNLNINSNLGVLVKEKPIIENDRVQYAQSYTKNSIKYTNDEVLYTKDEFGNLYNMDNKLLQKNENDLFVDEKNGNTIDLSLGRLYSSDGKYISISIKTKKEYMLDNNNKAIQIKCPWYEPNYTIYDTYIAEVVDFGSEDDKKDVNNKNLKFSEFKKINFKGFSKENIDGTENLYYKKHSMLCGYIAKNENNDIYKYSMYTKTDPYGAVQRWIARTLDDEWIQADDAYYVSDNAKTSSGDIVCDSTQYLTNHTDRVHNYDLSISGDDSKTFKKHYEGSFLETFGDDTIFYTDHYIINDESEVGDKNDNNYANNVKKVAGIYYSILDKNSVNKDGDKITDLGISTDHVRYTNFVKINTYNTDMRPSAATNNELRNGCIFKPSEENKENFGKIVKNASAFSTSYIKYNQDKTNEKVTIVVKSNRALKMQDDRGNYEKWYLDGWRYVSQMKNDTNVDKDIRNIYSSYSKVTPYSIQELYIYKTFDKNQNASVILTDMLENKKTLCLTSGEVKRGDINFDEKVNIIDLLLLKRHILLEQTSIWGLNGDAFKAANLDSKDDKLNIIDLLLLKKIILTGTV